MKNLIVAALAIFTMSSAAQEWNHENASFDKDGNVQLRDANGNIVNRDNSKAYRGLETTSAPTVLNNVIVSGDIPVSKEVVINRSWNPMTQNNLVVNLGDTFDAERSFIEIESIAPASVCSWPSHPYNSCQYSYSGVTPYIEFPATTGIHSTIVIKRGSLVGSSLQTTNTAQIRIRVGEVSGGTIQSGRTTINRNETKTINLAPTNLGVLKFTVGSGAGFRWFSYPYNSPDQVTPFGAEAQLVSNTELEITGNDAPHQCNVYHGLGGGNCDSSVATVQYWVYSN